MALAHLIIKKRMLAIQGKTRPCCHVQAIVEPSILAVLEEHFVTEPLFKRAAYASNWPKGAIEPTPVIVPALNTFLKNDACPEITVKTLLAGQMHQGSNVWEMMAFELLAKLAFDNFLGLCETILELDQELVFEGSNPPRLFECETDGAVEKLERMAAEMAA